MAVPKRRTSRSNTRHRRAQWKTTPPDLVPVVSTGDDTWCRATWSVPSSEGCSPPGDLRNIAAPGPSATGSGAGLTYGRSATDPGTKSGSTCRARSAPTARFAHAAAFRRWNSTVPRW